MAGEEDKDFDSFTLISTTSDGKAGFSDKLKAGKEWLQQKQASKFCFTLPASAKCHTVQYEKGMINVLGSVLPISRLLHCCFTSLIVGCFNLLQKGVV